MHHLLLSVVFEEESVEKRRLRGDPRAALRCLKGAVRKTVSSAGSDGIGKEKMDSN